MKLDQRIVTNLPIDELWTDSAILEYERKEYLTERQVQEIILQGKIAVVEASCGLKLSWVSPDQTLDFFKSKVKGHVADDPKIISLADFESNWCYLPSKWVNLDGQEVILLETYH